MINDSPLERFRRSMDIGFDQWHDGIGYDLDALAAATAEERADVERLLTGRAGNDWRDVEALAMLRTPGADEALREAFESAGADIRAAIMRDAPTALPPERFDAELVRLVDDCDLGDGMTHVLTLVEEHHPPEVLAALLRGTLDLDRQVPIHYAAMLLYLYGQAKEPFDWDVRPFLLGFTTHDPAERRAVYEELCERIGVEPA